MDLFLDCTSYSLETLKDLQTRGMFTAINGFFMSKNFYEGQFSSFLSSHANELPLRVLLHENGRLLNENFLVVGEKVTIKTPDDMNELMEREFSEELQYILIETENWHIIPLENLIAKFNGTSTQLLAVATSKEEVQLLEGILELGINGCILNVANENELELILESVGAKEETILPLQEFTVNSIERIGTGDRVCVDTCALLKEGEGLLVGGTATIFLLVEAEVAHTGFVSPRPFRVNAGALSLYVYGKEKTNYLSELQAGSKVFIVDKNGKGRIETVGRVKIERRPLILIRVLFEAREYHVILQEAETVRLVTTNGSIRVDELQPGDKVLGFHSKKGRHFGMAVEEFLEEH